MDEADTTVEENVENVIQDIDARIRAQAMAQASGGMDDMDDLPTTVAVPPPAADLPPKGPSPGPPPGPPFGPPPVPPVSPGSLPPAVKPGAPAHQMQVPTLDESEPTVEAAHPPLTNEEGEPTVEDASAPSLVFTPPAAAEAEQPAPPKPAPGPLLRPPTAEEQIGAQPLVVGMDNKVRPAQPGEQVDIDEISGTKPENKLLASAAVLVREGKLNDARRALESVLEMSPNNVQALTMLELVSSKKKKKKAKPKTRARRGRGLLVVLLLLVLLLCGGAAASMLITLPQQVTLPCTTSLIPLPEVRSSVEGTITQVKVSKGEVVKMGAVLALATNDRLVQHIEELKARIADSEDLVRIMKTAGTAKDDARLRKERKRLTKKIDELKKGCGNEECQVKLLKLEKQLKQVKTKLRFCEWEALPKEIKQAERELIKAQNELRGLASQRPEAEIKSPTGGIVVEIAAKGTALTKGAKLARMMVSNQIVVETTKGASQKPRKGFPAKITLKGKSTLSLNGTVDKVLAGGRFSCRVMTDATRIQKEGGACSVAIKLGKITLLNWLRKKYL